MGEERRGRGGVWVLVVRRVRATHSHTHTHTHTQGGREGGNTVFFKHGESRKQESSAANTSRGWMPEALPGIMACSGIDAMNCRKWQDTRLS